MTLAVTTTPTHSGAQWRHDLSGATAGVEPRLLELVRRGHDTSDSAGTEPGGARLLGIVALCVFLLDDWEVRGANVLGESIVRERVAAGRQAALERGRRQGSVSD